MRNLKKVLSLVLCVAMMLSVMVMSTGAVTITDADDISPQYAEAAEVLTGMGIINGYEDDSFQPQNSIKRSEVAAMIYRAATSDVEDNKVDIVADSDLFTDVNPDDWYAGYVNYCGDAEYIKGYEDDSFRAENQVTGYEVLAMILRAVGYDKNNEFTGDKWTIKVASTATELGMLENLDNSVNLNAPATREVVAELIFRAIEPAVETVHYSPAAGTYREEGSSLGEQQFKLTGPKDAIDDWGRPGTQWTYNTGDEETVIAMDALATYTEAATECDVAEAVGLEKTTQVDVYTNGADNKSTDNIRPLATKDTLGAQGQIMELYDANDDGKVDRIVYIDTYLAEVTEVKEATFDKAGHLDDSSELSLDVWTDEATTPEEVTLYGGKTDYDYTEGQFLLVQVVDEAQKGGSTPIAKDAETNEPDTLKIVDVADSIVGTQTTIFRDADQHEVNDKVYPDAVQFNMDAAQQNGDENFVWFFDQYDNLIGSAAIAADTNYGVITSIWWSGDPTDGSGKALANVTYTDGTTGQITLSEISYYYNNTFTEGTPVYGISTSTSLMGTVNGDFEVSTDAATNAKADGTQNDASHHDIIFGNLFQFTAKADGTMTAKEVAGNDDGLFAKTFAVSKDDLTNFAADNSTVFLIRSGEDDDDYAFESITGINNIGSYQSAEVDYVDVDKDGVADYVYVIGLPEDSEIDVLFYYADGQGSYNTKDKTYTIPGYIDGVEGNLVTADKDIYNKIADPDSKDKLYNVTIKNGKAIDINNNDAAYALAPTGTQVGDMTNNDNYADYEGKLFVSVITGEDNDKFVNNLYTDANGYVYVTNDNTKVYGEWDKDMSDKNVVLVWTGGAGASTNGLILQAYIVDQPEGDDQPEPELECTLDFKYDGSDKSIDVTLTASKALGEGTNLALYYKNPNVTEWTAYSPASVTYGGDTTNADGSVTYTYTLNTLNLGNNSVVDLRIDAVQNGVTLATKTVENVSIL